MKGCLMGNFDPAWIALGVLTVVNVVSTVKSHVNNGIQSGISKAEIEALKIIAHKPPCAEGQKLANEMNGMSTKVDFLWRKAGGENGGGG